MNSQALLRNETLRLLANRQREKPHYTKKNLAGELGMNLETFYKFLKGKRALRLKTATKYFRTLLPEDSWEKIQKEFQREETASAGVEVVKTYHSNGSNISQSPDQVAFGSDPLAWALVFLLETDDYQPSIQWKAMKLGIPEEEVQAKLHCIERLGLIEKSGLGYKRRENIPLTDKNDPTLARHREKLLPILAKSLPLGINERYFGHWYCAMDPQDFDRFKKLISQTVKRFEREQLLSKPKRVYCFMVGLFPMTN